MKKVILVVVMSLVLAACAPAAAPTAALRSDALASSPLVSDYADATSLRNQLAYGTILLMDTPQAVTPEQARALLPFWQAVRSLSGTSETASEELNAVQNQIIETMQSEQLQAIADMKITNAQLTAFYAELGIVMPTPAAGVTRVPGSGRNVSEADRQATRTAAEASGAAGSGNGKTSRTALFDKVIEMLTELSAK